MTLKEFYEKLEKHDWYYDMSDDQSVWRAGEAASASLAAEAHRLGAEFKSLLLDFHKHMFSGYPWDAPKHPLPKKPD